MSQTNLAIDPKRTRSGRWKLLLLLLVTLAPVIASYFTYYVIRPQGDNFYGQLISPQVEIPDMPTVSRDGQQVNLRSLRGQWLLMTAADAECNSACEKNLYLARQIHIGLGAEQDRVERVWLAVGDQPVPERVSKLLDGATVLRAPAASVAQWLQPEAAHELEEHMYLLDPQGFWMMRFPPNPDITAAASIKKTLNRLMRAAKFWDRPGR